MTENPFLVLNEPQSALSTRVVAGTAIDAAEQALLEKVLRQSGLKRDVSALAQTLLKRFETFARVIAATPEMLSEVDGLSAENISFLMLMRGACETMLTPNRTERVVLDNFEKLVDYLRVKLAPKPIEYIYAIYLNQQCQVLVAEELRCGYEAQVPIYPQEILQRALNLDAYHVVLVHNHPSGDALPSRMDVEMTSTIEKMLDVADIHLYDHLIISFEKIYSIRSRGFLPYRLNP